MRKWLTVTVLDPKGCVVGHVYGTTARATYEEKGERNRGRYLPGTYPPDARDEAMAEPWRICP